MSQHNVEIVRRVYDAAARRDAAAVFALYDTEVVLDGTRLGVVGAIGGVSRGHEGLRGFFREWHEAWENIEYDYDELIDAGEHVISVVTRRGRGRASGAEVELRLALLWTLDAGRVVRVVWFTSVEDALEAAGQSVSHENVDLVRRALEAAFRRPRPDFDTVNALYHPDHEFISSLEPLEGTVHRGARGFRDFLATWEEAFEWDATLEQAMAIDDDRVLAIVPTRIRGRQSGVPLEVRRVAYVLTVREGRIVRSEVYPSAEEALEAVSSRGG